MTIKKIAITGVTSGIGEQLAYQLADKGYALMLIARQADKLADIADTCQQLSSAPVTMYCADLSQKADVVSLAEHIHTVDIFIHNAGYGLFEATENFTFEQIEDMFAVNDFAPMYLTAQLLPHLYQKRAGQLIFIASQASKMATPKTSVYAATKFALRGFANALRLEAKQHGISVTTVNPGPVATHFFDVADVKGQYLQALGKYVLTPEDVAAKIVKAIDKPVREINLPFSMHVASKLYDLFPKIGDYFAANFLNKK